MAINRAGAAAMVQECPPSQPGKTLFLAARGGHAIRWWSGCNQVQCANITVQPSGSPVLEGLDETTTPKWSGVFQVNWTKAHFSLFLQERYIGAAKLRADWVEGVDVNINHTPAVFYSNATATYDLHRGGKQQIYLSVANLFDRAPSLSPPAVTTFTTAASSAYDPMGRYVTAGVLVRFGCGREGGT